MALILQERPILLWKLPLMTPDEMERTFSPCLRGKVLVSEPMRNHTSFRIGGPSDLFFQPADLEDLQQALAIAKQNNIPYFVLGGGNNLLVSDEGIRGIVIKLGSAFAGVEFKSDIILAGAGLSNSAFLQQVIEKEIAGFEFLAGVPGTLGGALIMNAGTYLGEVINVLKEAVFLTDKGEIRNLPSSELGLKYRSSSIPSGWIAIELVFSVVSGKREEIIYKINELKEKRKGSQPLTYPNAGSIFKNPHGEYAWRLIDSVGGRGLRYGNAQISEQHANFIINLGEAKACDVAALMRELQKRVKEKHNIQLVPEVALVGCWKEGVLL